MSKKAARRRGKHVTFYSDGVTGELVDFTPKGAQAGNPGHISYRVWETEYQDSIYLIEDADYVAPPVIIPSKASIAKIKASFKQQRNALSKEEVVLPKADEKREEGLRTLIRKVARWEGSKSDEDRLEARAWAKMLVELWPDCSNEVLAEFDRAAVAMYGAKDE